MLVCEQKRKAIRSFLFLKQKFTADGAFEKLKSRLTANGATQVRAEVEAEITTVKTIGSHILGKFLA